MKNFSKIAAVAAIIVAASSSMAQTAQTQNVATSIAMAPESVKALSDAMAKTVSIENFQVAAKFIDSNGGKDTNKYMVIEKGNERFRLPLNDLNAKSFITGADVPVVHIRAMNCAINPSTKSIDIDTCKIEAEPKDALKPLVSAPMPATVAKR